VNALETAPALRQIFSWIVTLLVPVVLIMAGVRLLLTPVFVPFEYSTPGFPDDPFGFTRQDRLRWSQIAVDYLLNDEGISFLGDLRFDDGQPVYNERELQHMVDVKNVVQAALLVWYVSLGLLAALGVGGYLAGLWPEFQAGLARGGLLTVILLGAIILFVLIAFGVIFVAFHNVFFAPGTWTFLHSDTLIRLFPERFWRDTFLAIGLLAGVPGLALWYFFRR
jgi:integral membrane protein (TIGR01906 family)